MSWVWGIGEEGHTAYNEISARHMALAHSTRSIYAPQGGCVERRRAGVSWEPTSRFRRVSTSTNPSSILKSILFPFGDSRDLRSVANASVQ